MPDPPRNIRQARERLAQSARGTRGAAAGAPGAAPTEAWPRQVEARPLKPETAVSVGGNCLLILLESVFVLLGVGFFIGSMLMVDVLKEIRQRDFSEPMKRIKTYQEFLDGLRRSGCQVVKDNPRITNPGETTYLWTVEPKGRDDLCRFQWLHVIDSNKIEPQTSAALLLDIHLGYLSLAQATSEYAAIYNPNDQIALGLIQANPNAGGVAGGGNALPAPPEETGVLPPLVSPEEAKGRARGGKPKEEEVPAEGEGESGDTPPVVEDPNAPPADGGGDQPPTVDPGAGDGGGDAGGGDTGGDGGGGGDTGGDGGGETPPDGGGGGGETPPNGGGE